MTYPIPVRDFDGNQALTIICETCRTEAVISPDEILNEGMYRCPSTRCDGIAVMKYEVADECPGCGRLGWWDRTALGGACSRRCHLQAEYAAAIQGRAA